MSRPPQLHHGFEAEFPHLMALALRVTTRLLHDRYAAEDAAAEALARTALRWSQVGALDHRDAWVQRVAANVAIDVLRRRRRPPEPAAGAFADQTDPVLGRLEVADLLRGLPSRQREVLVLRYLLDLSTDDVAAALGISANSVKTHTTRGLDALRRRVPGLVEEATVAH